MNNPRHIPSPQTKRLAAAPCAASSSSGQTFAAAWTGWAALALTILMWAGFALSIRAIASSALTAADVALIRFAVPALALAPLLPSRWKVIRAAPRGAAALVAIGAGVPFFLLASAGGSLASAAHVGALIAGTSPLFASLLSRLLYGQAVEPARVPGLSIIGVGVVMLALGLGTTGPGLVGGIGLLLAASMLWALYAIGIRATRLDPVSCVLLIVVPSTAMVGGLICTGLLESHLPAARPARILPFVLVQGVGVGLVASAAFTVAVARLGAVRCATYGALSPVLTTLLAYPLLGEIPSLLTSAGVIAVTLGVILARRRV